jgi:hypothetical protein
LTALADGWAMDDLAGFVVVLFIAAGQRRAEAALESGDGGVSIRKARARSRMTVLIRRWQKTPGERCRVSRAVQL